MICQVIIQDCLIDRRMVYILDDADFAMLRCRSDWRDLGVPHYHGLIASILDSLAGKSDEERGDPTDPTVLQLTFFLCGLIATLQSTHSHIEVLRVTRLTATDLLYEYTASLEMV